MAKSISIKKNQISLTDGGYGVIALGQSSDIISQSGKSSSNTTIPDVYDIQEIKTIQDVNGDDVYIYGNIKRENIKSLLNMKKSLQEQIDIVTLKIDAIKVIQKA